MRAEFGCGIYQVVGSFFVYYVIVISRSRDDYGKYNLRAR